MDDIEKRARFENWCRNLGFLSLEKNWDGDRYADSNTSNAWAAWLAASTPPEGWVAAVDRELVCAELGVANADDSLEVAAQKLHDLIMWNVQVATDPAVNGGFVLVPLEPTQEMVDQGTHCTHAEDWEVRSAWIYMLSHRPEVK